LQSVDSKCSQYLLKKLALILLYIIPKNEGSLKPGDLPPQGPVKY
jgi:hypothetical protein